jgi:hypothetical protein
MVVAVADTAVVAATATNEENLGVPVLHSVGRDASFTQTSTNAERARPTS